MKASTEAYITLQKLYKEQAEREKATFKSFISRDVEIDDSLIDSFVRNAHAIRIIRASSWSSIDRDPGKLGEFGLCKNIVRAPLTCKKTPPHD